MDDVIATHSSSFLLFYFKMYVFKQQKGRKVCWQTEQVGPICLCNHQGPAAKEAR